MEWWYRTRPRWEILIQRIHMDDLEKLDIRVQALEREKQIPLTRTATTVGTAALILLMVVGFIVSVKSCDADEKYDFLAYIFPLAAGWMAGLGLYKRQLTVGAFKLTVALLCAGFVCYLRSKHMLETTLLDGIGFAGLVFSLILWRIPGNKPDDLVDRALKPVYPTIVGFSIVVMLFWLWFIVVNANGWVAKGLHIKATTTPAPQCPSPSTANQQISQSRQDQASAARASSQVPD